MLSMIEKKTIQNFRKMFRRYKYIMNHTDLIDL